MKSCDVKGAMEGLEFDQWGSSPKIDPLTMATTMKGVFCGGDLAGTAETAVEAAADGKIAAWSIHRHLQVIQSLTYFWLAISTKEVIFKCLYS